MRVLMILHVSNLGFQISSGRLNIFDLFDLFSQAYKILILKAYRMQGVIAFGSPLPLPARLFVKLNAFWGKSGDHK